jgi:hypothetical protein
MVGIAVAKPPLATVRDGDKPAKWIGEAKRVSRSLSAKAEREASQIDGLRVIRPSGAAMLGTAPGENQKRPWATAPPLGIFPPPEVHNNAMAFKESTRS